MKEKIIKGKTGTNALINFNKKHPRLNAISVSPKVPNKSYRVSYKRKKKTLW